MTTVSDLQGYINIIKENETDLFNLVDEIDNKFKVLTDGPDLGPDWLNTIVYGYEPPGDKSWVDSQRDEAKRVVGNLLYGTEGDGAKYALDKFIVGMDLPIDLITIAATWRDIKNDVTLAQALERETLSLQNTWKGEGATAYETMRFKEQDFAFTAMINVAELTATELEKIASEVSKYYMDLQKSLVKLVATVKDFWAKIISAEFVKAFVNAVTEICGTVVDFLANIVNTLTSTAGAENRLAYLTMSQVGFSSTNQWPQPTVYPFADFSTTDGDGSDWNTK